MHQVRQNVCITLPKTVNLNALLLCGGKGLDIVIRGILLLCVCFGKKSGISGIDHARRLHRVVQLLARLPRVHFSLCFFAVVCQLFVSIPTSYRQWLWTSPWTTKMAIKLMALKRWMDVLAPIP